MTQLYLAPTKLLERIEMGTPEDCWEWTGYRNPGGYGRFQGRLAHHLTYELWVGPIPSGLEVDHLCSNTGCVNPLHLEPVTGAENIRRAAARRTHCPNGHPYTDANTGRTSAGQRRCRECHRLNERHRREQGTKNRVAS